MPPGSGWVDSLRSTGQLVIAAVMWVPAFATYVTIRFVTREGFGVTNLRFGNGRPYLKAAVIVPLAFVAIYLLTWLLGLGSPDWRLGQFYSLVARAGAVPTWPPLAFLGALFVSTVLFTPFLNSVFGFGEEFGWRGYLLPKLMPLGKVRAYLLLGIIWGLWHAPLVAVGFNYPGHPVAGIIAMMGFTTALGVFLNEMTLRHRSCILAGWMHGLVNSQAYGVWRILFPDVHPLLGGIAGLVGMAVWLALGLWEMRPAVRSMSLGRHRAFR